MTAVTWARTVECDFPGCQSVGTVEPAAEFGRELPAGWLDVTAALDIRTIGGVRSKLLRELCTIHAAFSVASLVAATTPPEVTDDDDDG